MASALTPREIQARIRSGESLADVAEVAGLPPERVERFAAPVIAEREYVAGQALAASVRRRGETSGHRNLRTTVTERLVGRGIEVDDDLVWDAYRVEDNRWAVTATYRSGQTERVALFLYDSRGRFSVAGNDDARSVLAEENATEDAEDVEPTLDLGDELAIVRAVLSDPAAPADVRSEAGELAAAAERDRSEALEDTVVVGLAEESAVPYPGLSDASAVPESASRRGPGWEPAIVVNYPVEPSQVEPPDEWGEELTGTDEPGAPDATVELDGRQDEAEALEDEHGSAADPDQTAEPDQTAPKRTGRKRASVPSWDEIMFGAPKRP